MTSSERLSQALSTVLGELLGGSHTEPCFVLNPGDPGLLASLDRLSAADASAPAAGGGASIAAHVDHVRYGFELLNRWVRGEKDVFERADYSQSWRRTTVNDAAWADLRRRLKVEAEQWSAALRQPHDYSELELTGAIASVAHLAYHFGAIRQIDRSIAGPPARD